MQSSSEVRELAWRDRPLAELVRLAGPITVSMLSFSVMTLVDTLFVGHLGSASLAGVGLGGVLALGIAMFSIGVLRGIKVLVAQAVGARRRDRIGAFAAAGISLALGLGLASALVGIGLAQVLPRLTGGSAAGQLAALYLSIRVLGAPVMLVYVALRETMYGAGDARTPMVATVCANLANVALCALFVGGLGLGVAGAAWATVLAHLVETGVCLLGYRGERLPRLFGDRAALREVWRMGLPNGLQMLIEVGSFVALSLLISAMGEVDMAAHQIALSVIHVSFLPAFAIGEAASILAGQAVGAARDELVVQVARRALWLAGLYTGACAIGFASLAAPIARCFTGDVAVVTAAVGLLYVAAAFQVADAANIIARCILRGTGDVRYPAVLGIVIAWCSTPPLTWLLGYRAGLGALGGWLGLLVEIAVASAVFWVRLERGGWKRAAAVSRQLVRGSGLAA